ncbi:MAG: thymidine phosphorylase [Bacilli bacterium]
MNIVEIINKKRLKEVLSKEELEHAFNGYLKDLIPDYQMSSLLMAICINGMSDEEIFNLTDIFINSGDKLDLSMINSIKVDKHSTGGVGDKTTLIVLPLVASCGVVVPKMSGRGLGHTGGTIDKLESIPGFKVDLDENEFLNLIKKNGLAITSQTKNLTPLDKKIYALRDVTGTTESIPLIASSIMSKKIAGSANKILVDIKVGTGALIKTMGDAVRLSEIMKKIGAKYQVEVRTLMTPMDNPLGRAIGNRIEVMEAINVLEGKDNSYLTELSIQIASHMVSMGKNISYDEAKEEVLLSLNNKEAYQKFISFIISQGGNLSKLVLSSKTQLIKSPKTGIITEINALKMGNLAVSLGAGRSNKTDIIKPDVGIFLNKVVGEQVNIGDTLCTLYVDKECHIPVQDYFIIK